MLHRMWRLAAGWLVSALFLVACGGGGGGGDSVEPSPGTNTTPSDDFRVAFDRNEVSWTGRAGAMAPVVVNVTSSGTPRDNVYAGVTTPAGGLDPNLALPVVTIDNTTRTAKLSLAPNAGLAPGTYKGTVHAKVCRDMACTKHYPGSPHEITYSITVADNLRVSASLLNFSTSPGTTASQPVTVTLPAGVTAYTVTSDDAGVVIDQQTSSGFRVTVPARSPGTFHYRLAVVSGDYRVEIAVLHAVTPRPLILDKTSVPLSAVSGQTARATVGVIQLAEGQSGFTAAVTSGYPWLKIVSTSSNAFVVEAMSLPSGDYTGAVEVASGSDRRYLQVDYKVSPPPGGNRFFSVATTAITLSAVEGGSAPPARLGVTRASWDPTVDVRMIDAFGVTIAPAWLTVTPRPDGDFDVLADARGLARGTYTASLRVAGPYPNVGASYVSVSFTVGDGLAVPASRRIVLGGETAAAALPGTVPVIARGTSTLTWTATSNVPWLKLTRTAGTLGQDATYELDVAAVLALPGYVDHVATVTIQPQSPDATPVAFTPVAGTVTFRRELPELHYVGPDVLESGKAAKVFVRGRGFDHLADPAARLRIAGVTPLSVQRVSATSLAVSLPALTTGQRALTISSTLAGTSQPVQLRVMDAAPRLATSMVTGGNTYGQDGVTGIVHDPRRNDIYLANSGLSAVQRFREGAGGWTLRTLALPTVHDIGMSPDGAWLVVVQLDGKLHLVDPDTFTISHTFAGVGPVYRTPVLGHGLPVTNDGRVWLAIGDGWNDMVTFDLHARRFDVVVPEPGIPTTFYDGPWFEVSRNGERLVAVQSAGISSRPPMLYMDASLNQWQVNPVGIEFFYWSQSGLSTDGGRFLTLDTVYDATFGRIGGIKVPDANWFEVGAVPSPDGQRVYLIASTDQGNGATPSQPLRVYVFDANVPAGTVTTLPLLGSFELTDYPMCWPRPSYSNCPMPVVTMSFDSRTLFIAGASKMMSVPVPSVLTPPLSAGPAPMTLWRKGGAATR